MYLSSIGFRIYISKVNVYKSIVEIVKFDCEIGINIYTCIIHPITFLDYFLKLYNHENYDISIGDVTMRNALEYP